jgi:pimeloyl-ACP methyl ester carboxylesterase
MQGATTDTAAFRGRLAGIQGTAIRTIALLMALAFAALAAASHAAAQPAFYHAPLHAIPGPAGSIIRAEPMVVSPTGSTAYRVLYRSRGLTNEPIAVSGIVVVPLGPLPPGGRKVVAWAHPTSGVVPHCGPSRSASLYLQMMGHEAMLARGYAIAATDYPGLGTPGPHPYLVGVSEARSVLDSVRAAQAMPGVGRVRDFAVWGHSQGGHAALYTGLIARSYAPELRLVGVAAAAPATELGVLFNDDIGTSGGKNLAALALWSWARVFNAPAERVVYPGTMAVVDNIASICIESITDVIDRSRAELPLEKRFLAVKNLPALEPWRTLMNGNTPGPLPRDIPVFISQGTADDTVRPQVTLDYANRLCRNGSRLKLFLMNGVSHTVAALDSAVVAVEWMQARFAGYPAPSDCK